MAVPVEGVPDLIERIYRVKGSEGSALRALRNNLVFVAADEARKEDMRRKACRRLALAEMKKPERIIELAEHQQAQVREMEARSEQELAIAIQQCYRHVFYPSRHRVGTSEVDLAHTAIDIHSTSDQPGVGQQQVIRTLRDLNKMRLSEDEPDSPAYVRDRTPLKKGQISSLSLRDEFRRDPALPILVGDDIFIRGVRRGIEQGEYVYQRGELLYGPGDPAARIEIDEKSMIFTMGYAKNFGLWPRSPASPPEQLPADTTVSGVDEASVSDGTDEATEDSSGGSGSVLPTPGTFTAEGVLREALVRIWEQARSKKVVAISVLTVRMFEAGDAFRLLGAVGAVSGAERIVMINGGYETRDGGSFELEFRGPVSDAQPVREFLEPQLRDASSRDLQASFALTFESGLSMEGRCGGKVN